MNLYDAARLLPEGDVVARLEQVLDRQPSVDAMRLSRWVQSLRGHVQSLRVDDLPTIDRLEALVSAAIRRGT